MQRLGYARYVAQGGDWGTAITAAMARQAPEGLLGIHVNFAQMVPLDMLGHIRNGDPAPADLSDAEKRAYGQVAFATYHRGYGVIQGTRPQTIGYSLADKECVTEQLRNTETITRTVSTYTELADLNGGRNSFHWLADRSAETTLARSGARTPNAVARTRPALARVASRASRSSRAGTSRAPVGRPREQGGGCRAARTHAPARRRTPVRRSGR